VATLDGLSSGILIGPMSLALWGFILQLRGAVRSVWQGDGLVPGLEQCMVFALIVGSLTSTFMCSRCDAFPAGALATFRCKKAGFEAGFAQVKSGWRCRNREV
jgi:hypothetical protein